MTASRNECAMKTNSHFTRSERAKYQIRVRTFRRSDVSNKYYRFQKFHKERRNLDIYNPWTIRNLQCRASPFEKRKFLRCLWHVIKTVFQQLSAAQTDVSRTISYNAKRFRGGGLIIFSTPPGGRSSVSLHLSFFPRVFPLPYPRLFSSSTASIIVDDIDVPRGRAHVRWEFVERPPFPVDCLNSRSQAVESFALLSRRRERVDWRCFRLSGELIEIVGGSTPDSKTCLPFFFFFFSLILFSTLRSVWQSTTQFGSNRSIRLCVSLLSFDYYLPTPLSNFSNYSKFSTV